MKKVLFMLHWPPPVHGSAIVGKYIKESNKLNSQFKSDYINLTTSKIVSEIGRFNIKKIITFLSLIFTILKKNFTVKYDLVYLAISINGKAFYRDALIVLIVKMFKRKIIFHLHNKGASMFEGLIRKKLYSFVFENTDVILLSEYLYQDVAQYVDKSRIYICHNGIESNSYIKYEMNDKLKETNFNILFLSNMIASKGVYVLLDACSKLVTKYKNFKCHFVGAWKDITEEEFTAYVTEKKIAEVVQYHGPKYDQEKEYFWSLANIFVFPTFYEQECFPLVLLEAMQHKLPIISTYEGGIQDIVTENSTGYICKQRDAVGLAEKIELYMNNSELVKKHSEEAYKIYNEKFTIEVFETRLIKILKTV